MADSVDFVFKKTSHAELDEMIVKAGLTGCVTDLEKEII